MAPDAKDAAREHVLRWLGERGPGAAAVRVNAAGAPGHGRDLAALATLVGNGCPVMVSKAEHPDALAEVTARLAPGTRLLALVETAAGVLGAPAIARAPGVERLVLGTYDLAAQLGVPPDDRLAMAGARQTLVLASAAAGLAPPVDGVTGDVVDGAVLRDDLDHAVRLGFGGKLCVHPRQVPLARAAFQPEGRRRGLGYACRRGGTGVVVLGGAMVDKPVVDRARRVLAARRA